VQRANFGRHRALLPERGWLSDAVKKRPEAARSALFRTAEEVRMAEPSDVAATGGALQGRIAMLHHGTVGAFALKAAALTAALMTTLSAAMAFDDSKYPDWRGQWDRQRVANVPGQPSFDPNKGWGKLQEAPLTAEYQKVLDDNLKSQKEGGFF